MRPSERLGGWPYSSKRWARPSESWRNLPHVSAKLTGFKSRIRTPKRYSRESGIETPCSRDGLRRQSNPPFWQPDALKRWPRNSVKLLDWRHSWGTGHDGPDRERSSSRRTVIVARDWPDVCRYGR